MSVVRLAPSLVLGLVLGLVLALPVAAPTSVAHADGVADEADLQFQIGADAYRRGDFLGAAEHFLASNRLVPNRNVMFNIARAFEQLGRFPDAYRYYVDALRGESDAAIRREVEAAIARVSPRVAVVEITSTPPGAAVYLDRTDLGSVGTTPARLGLPAGSYKILLRLDGYQPRGLGPFELKVGTRTPVDAGLTLIVGSIAVAGPPGTEVRLDTEGGPAACVVPCQVEVRPGPHQLYFSRAGFRSSPRAVTVAAGETSVVKAELTAETGSLLVSTDEPGALVEIDGRRVAFTPAVVAGVDVGHRQVRVSLRGYQPIERAVDIVADQQTDLADLSLEPVREVSAASRETQRIEDAPASVTVLDRQELAAFAYPTILEALRGVRGFAVNYDSIYGNASVRGLGQANDYNNRLLVLSDGAVLNENVLYQPFIHYDGRTDLGDVERIEIVRGPASVLYGTGAVSGVVNLVLRGRDVSDGVHAEASTYDGSTARVRFGGARHLGTDAGVWASLAMARSDGRDVDLVFDDGSGTADRHTAHGFDKFDSYTVTGKAWWKGVTLQGFYTNRHMIVPTGSFASIYDDPRNLDDDRRFLTELKYEGALSKKAQLLLRTYLNYAYYHQDAVFDITEDPADPLDQRYIETYRSWWAGAEARLALTLGPRLKLSIGSEATIHTKVAMHTGQYEQDGTFTRILNVDSPYQVVAGYALLDWEPSPRLSVQAGARFDYWNIGGNQEAAEGESNVITSFPAVSPRVAIIAKPNDKDVVKLMAGTAFRAPSAFEYYYGDNGSTQVPSSQCGETLEPENVYSIEVEASRRLARDWVGLAAAHTTYATDIVETVPVPMEARCGNDAGQIDPAVTYYRNSEVGQLLIGADLELRREWRSGTMLAAQYGVLRPRYTSAPDASVDDRALPNAPGQFASLKGVVPIVANLVTGAARVTYEDRRRVDTSSTLRTGRAVVADVVLSGVVGRHDLRYAVGVYNLFDWQYSQAAFPYASNLMPQAGRSFILSVGYQR